MAFKTEGRQAVSCASGFAAQNGSSFSGSSGRPPQKTGITSGKSFCGTIVSAFRRRLSVAGQIVTKLITFAVRILPAVEFFVQAVEWPADGFLASTGVAIGLQLGRCLRELSVAY